MESEHKRIHIRNVDPENRLSVEEFLEHVNSLNEFGLTHFQIKYVKSRAKGHNMKESAIAAGSGSKRPEQIGSDLEKKYEIQLAIEWQRKKICEAASLEVDEIIQMFQTVYSKALQDDKLETARKCGYDLANILGMVNKPSVTKVSKTQKEVINEDTFTDYKENEQINQEQQQKNIKLN